jgi:hypothetical protein
MVGLMILLFDARCSRVGGVAQLGEHLLCKQGVIGSIPIVSTTDASPEVARLSLSQPAPWRCGGNRLLANDESRSPDRQVRRAPAWKADLVCIAESPNSV